MPDPTTVEGRAELRQLHAAATTGPWEGVPGFGRTAIYGHDHDPGEFVAQQVGIPDTKLIIAAVNALPALLDALDEAEQTRQLAARADAAFRIARKCREQTDSHMARADAAEAALAEARQTNTRLNRRCQEAEQAAAENIDACARKGQSMGRGLANYAARMYLERAEKTEAAIAEAQEIIRGHEGALEGLATTIGEHRAQLDAIRGYAKHLWEMARQHESADAPYLSHVYATISRTLERKIGDRT